MKSKLLLGAHMSIADGFEQSIISGASIGCTAIQIFTHSNRQWQMKELSQKSVALFKGELDKTHMNVTAHASYLINLGSNSTETVSKSLKTLEHELINCDQLSIKNLVLHPGSGQKNATDCINQVAQNINEIFDKKNSSAVVLLEIMAGQGDSICYTFEQLAELRSLIKNKNRIGVCFDTCHAWSAGYDFSTDSKYHKMWEDFDKIIGIEHLKVFHLNDSKRELGAHVDRHEDIGKGKIGINAFKLIMNDKNFFNTPKILETPKKDLISDSKNMETLKELISAKTKKELDI